MKVVERSTLRAHLRWPYMKMLISASLGVFLVGFNSVFLVALVPLVKSELGLTKNRPFESSMLFLGLLGRTVGMVIAICNIDFCGRRNTMCWAAVMFTVGVGLSIVLPWITTMMIGRFITEVAVGVVDMATPVYISEITPYRVRGMVLTLQLIPEAIGQLSGHGVKAILKMVLGNWKIFVFIEGILSIIYIYAMYMVLDTPRFLYRQAMMDMDVDKYLETVDLIRSICPPHEAEHELYSLQSGVEEEIEERGSLIDDRKENPLRKACRAWCEKATRKALVTWLLCSSLPQLCGINLVVFLSSVVTKASGINQGLSDFYKSFVLCWLKMTGSAIGACLLDVYEISRKGVFQVSFMGMIATLGGITVLLHGKTSLSLNHALLALGFLILCVGFFYIGYGAAATIIEEACPLRYRGISVGAVWINSFICKHIIAEIALIFIRRPDLAAPFSALFFWNLVLLGLVWRYVPKTTAMPLELGWRTLKDLKRTKARRYTA